MVKQIVSTDQNIAEETRDKLVSISSIESYSRYDLESPGNHLIDSTSEEIESSTQSILSSLDITSEKTDEDLELSAVRSVREFRTRGATDTLTVNNSRANKRPNQVSSHAWCNFHLSCFSCSLWFFYRIAQQHIWKQTWFYLPSPHHQPFRNTFETFVSVFRSNMVHLHRTSLMRAMEICNTTLVTVIFFIRSINEFFKWWKSVNCIIWNQMEFKGMRGGVFQPRKLYVNTILPAKLFWNKKPVFRVKLGNHAHSMRPNIIIIRILFTSFVYMEISLHRIRFGKTAMKCTDCLGTCHVECKSSMPTPCVPTCRTPTHFVGSIADYSPKTTPMIPSLIIHCVEEIEARGLEEPGIYRTNAPDKEVVALKVRFFKSLRPK